MGRREDLFWEYAEKLEVEVEGKLKHQFKCKFCHKKFSGDITRVKSHLSGLTGGGVEICTVPENIRNAAAEAISGPNKRARTEACSSKTKENSPKMLINKDGVIPSKVLAMFILSNDLDVDIVQRPSFIDFVNVVAEHGSNYRLPGCSEVKTKLVPDLEKEIGEHVANVMKSWDRTGCTLISAIRCDKGMSFINILAFSNEGMVLLSTLEIHKDELTSTRLRKALHSVTQKIGANNIAQYITNSDQEEGFYEDVPIGNNANVYQINCVAHEIHELFEDIYNYIEWIRKVFVQAKAVVAKVQGHDRILLSIKQFTNNWELKESSTTKFYSNYYMLQSIMRVEKELHLLVSSPEWISLGFEKDESGVEVGEIIRSSEFWIEGNEVLHALEPIFRVICLVDSYGATSGFLYAAVEMADEAIKQMYKNNVHKYQMLWALFKLRKSKIIHPIHAGAAFLNPAYMCSKKFIEDNAMKQGVDFILKKLVSFEEKEKFVQNVQHYRDKMPKLFAYKRTSHLCDWWDFCGDDLPVLKKYAIQILSQPCSTSFCRQSLSAFDSAQTEKRKPLMPAMKDDCLYLRANALLMENFNTIKEKFKKPLDLEKLGELPDCTEFVNENFTHDLVNETEDLLSDGKLNCWSASARKDWESKKHLWESKKHLRLHFITRLPLSLIRGDEIMGEEGAPIHVILADSNTGGIVQSGPLSMLRLMVTVIEGDFNEEAGEDWTREFFERNELEGREGNMPLLTGDLSVILNRGMGTLGAITVNDVSGWTRSGKFRLGVKTASGCCEGFRVLEGTSNAFAVEDEGSDADEARRVDEALIELFDRED